MKRNNSQNMLDEFLLDMESSHKSRNTIVNYKSDIKHFLDKYPSGIENVTVELLREYLSGMSHKSPTTRARNISSLKRFLDWCYKKDFIIDNPILKIEREKQNNAFSSKKVEKSEIQAIISSISEDNLKYKLIFALMLEAGLKVCEVLSLQCSDIEADTQSVFVKSGQSRRIPLFSSESIRLFKLYTEKTNINSGLIFQVSYQALNKFWRKCCARNKADIKLHQIRDCYAEALIERGINICIVSHMLGHKNLQTTAKYFTN